jgi:hypothetical protein
LESFLPPPPDDNDDSNDDDNDAAAKADRDVPRQGVPKEGPSSSSAAATVVAAEVVATSNGGGAAAAAAAPADVLRAGREWLAARRAAERKRRLVTWHSAWATIALFAYGPMLILWVVFYAMATGLTPEEATIVGFFLASLFLLFQMLIPDIFFFLK